MSRKKTFKLLSFMLCLMFALGPAPIRALAKPDWPSDTGIQAEAGIVIDAETGTVLFGQNIHEPYPPASITKLLTALVVLENVASLDEEVLFSQDAVHNVEEGSGNWLLLETGDRLSVRDCLYAALLQSSNQACNALAEHVGGSREGFVEMMNQKIRELGCRNSNFMNPSGLNDDHQYVTPYDMALIAKACFAHETILQISGEKSYKLGPIQNRPNGVTMQMKHKLLIAKDSSSEYYYPAAIAGKTGYTSLAGNTLVTYAVQGERELITVILKSRQTHYSDTISLLEFGFNQFENVSVAEHLQQLFDADGNLVIGDETYPGAGIAARGVQEITLPKGAQVSDADCRLNTEYPDTALENVVGMVEYSYNDRKIGSYYLTGTKASDPEPVPSSASLETTAALPSENGEAQPVSTGPESITAKAGRPAAAVRVILTVLAVAGLGGGLIFILWHQTKKRREKAQAEQEQRRQKRMQRLKEIGYSEEEFRELVEQKKKK